MEEWESVWTEEGRKQTGEAMVSGRDQPDPRLEAEGQQLLWDKHVMMHDLRGDVYQVYTAFDEYCSQFTRQYGPKGCRTTVIVGATVLVKGVSLRQQGVVPSMRIELRMKLHGGAVESQPLAALAIFRVQKYDTWRGYLLGAPPTAGAFTRTIENMVRRFSGDRVVLLAELAKVSSGFTPDHLWPLLGPFEIYAGAVLDFSVLRYVQVQRGEYHNTQDWDALHEAREVEIEEEVVRAAQHEPLEANSDEESPYDAPTLDNMRKILKRPGAPKGTIGLSRALLDYLQEPERVGEQRLAHAVWNVMKEMHRQGVSYLKEQRQEKKKKEKKRRKERKKARKEAKKSGKERKGKKSTDWSSFSSSSSGGSTAGGDNTSSSSSSSAAGPPKITQQPKASKCGKPEMRILNGRREFWSHKQPKWINCTNPPEVPCPKCAQRHWYHKAEAFGCGA